MKPPAYYHLGGTTFNESTDRHNILAQLSVLIVHFRALAAIGGNGSSAFRAFCLAFRL